MTRMLFITALTPAWCPPTLPPPTATAVVVVVVVIKPPIPTLSLMKEEAEVRVVVDRAALTLNRTSRAVRRWWVEIRNGKLLLVVLVAETST